MGAIRDRDQLACHRCGETSHTVQPDPDPDDATWIEPPFCPECDALVRVYPTNYDRWVSLAMVELPSKDVPEAFRWRLTRLPGQSPHPHGYRGRTGPWNRSATERTRRTGSPHDVHPRVR
ncbi:DUF6083 domain-containing protein [Streptomyces sp. NPDC006476]|uniref:DUF6083 domain-containing protein n=1 Tax=Streptomyces sp. NPDC006476 TaxID=3157175 RepID=UPI0033AB42CF